MLQKAMIFTLVLSFTSCAPITQRISKNNKRTPGQMINDYKVESQKRNLDEVVAEKNDNAPKFLRKVNNKKVDFWVKYFSKRDKERFERYLKNGEKYRGIIEEIMVDHGLPKELYYVGLIESGYNLRAKSHANAVGPWQFIKATAKRYGLTVKYGVDERKSIHKSTKAAALFFQDLYNIFGSWELALSAYNAGEYGVIRRIRKANTRDYYKLSAAKKLPKETRNYVPKVLAAIKIMENPDFYNINVPRNVGDLYANTKSITVKNAVSLNKIAKRKGVSVKTLRRLNPDLTINTTPYIRREGYELRVPNGNYAFVESMKPAKTRSRKVANNAPNTKNKKYRVRKGDNLSQISRRFNVNLTQLRKANRLSRKGFIRVGQVLTIPQNSTDADPQYLAYKVRRGDNLYSIARTHHTSVSKIMKLNSLRERTIYAGQKLRLPYIEKTFYTVRPGDYLGKIASKFGLSIREIKKLNSLRRTTRIYPGQRLVVKLN
jgi:membrane-bound lytic murein transglycosylase D